MASLTNGRGLVQQIPKYSNLIQLGIVPNKKVLQNIQKVELDELSSCFKNICQDVYAYNMSNPSQQLELTKGTAFFAYNAITGCFQNVRTYKDGKQNSRPFCMAVQHIYERRKHFSCIQILQKERGSVC
ncbi:DUF932 domain-containing protein [Lacibacter sp.]|uniref:DUF932 domain-containing protein n=1 Tax=Lacibacter sp. TaxID=1915409 RepID=UPI002B4B8521|nr:hypothetical protein [Lacibacter sp.]HLP38952.1 hypothetical protein [Lacibacter sp.]